MTTPRTGPTDLRPLLLARLDALGDEAAALALAVAEHPGPILPPTMEILLSAADVARNVLADAWRELPGAGGPEAAGAREVAT
jgi:hypothetical protein